jgi:hypothetical protein
MPILTTFYKRKVALVVLLVAAAPGTLLRKVNDLSAEPDGQKDCPPLTPLSAAPGPAPTTMTLDADARRLTVQRGATWYDIQTFVHPRFAVKAMQSTDIFTVGGSISVNAHGMDHLARSVANSLVALRVMLADGSIRTVTPTENAELFRLVVRVLFWASIALAVVLFLKLWIYGG